MKRGLLQELVRFWALTEHLRVHADFLDELSVSARNVDI